ncbi:MAG: shikimate kinase [Phycisphaerales bacterium]
MLLLFRIDSLSLARARRSTGLIMLHAHLILLGLRGSGKTTIGRLLARKLGSPFVDLDDRSPVLLGSKSVAHAWSAHGEAAFRQAETDALRAVLGEPACVVALGGGTPTAPGARAILTQARERGAVLVYLRGTPAALVKRLARSDNSHRPSLTGKPAGSLEEIEQVFRARDDLYAALATRVVEIGAQTIDHIVDRCATLVTSV